MDGQTYTTFGSVRRSCGHRHRSLRTALDCRDSDSRGCHSVGGYSDRAVVRVDDRHGWAPLSEDEHEALCELIELRMWGAA